jgi:hypothetical protein
VILAGQQSSCLRSTKHLHCFWQKMLLVNSPTLTYISN